MRAVEWMSVQVFEFASLKLNTLNHSEFFDYPSLPLSENQKHVDSVRYRDSFVAFSFSISRPPSRASTSSLVTRHLILTTNVFIPGFNHTFGEANISSLKIKAAPAPVKATGARAAESHAVLCTPTQTFTLRHVHCSNSILLVQPSPTSSSLYDGEDNAFPLTSTGLTVVSAAASWLELIPTTPGCEHLRDQLPLYHGWTDDVPSPSVSQEYTSRENLLDSTPASDAEFSAAWDALLAFETKEGIAYRPSPGAVLKTISEIFTSSTAESFSLSSPAGFNVAELLRVLDDADVPEGLVAAVVNGMCKQQEGNMWRLGIEKCCAFVGKALLEDWAEQVAAKKVKSDMLYISFMSKWKAAIPEECMRICKLETIKGWYTLPTPNTVRFVPTGDAESAVGPSPAPSGAGKAMPVKNKWHERLGKKR